MRGYFYIRLDKKYIKLDINNTYSTPGVEIPTPGVE